MKITLLSIPVILMVAFTACNQGGKADTAGSEDHTTGTAEIASDFTIDPGESVITWKGSMLGVYDHTGTIGLSEGNITSSGGQVSGGAFTVDMASIVTTDDDALYKMASREQLVEHLKSDDFFNTESYPSSTFTITSFEGNTIMGELTIRGITHSESVEDVIITHTDDSFTASGTLTFSRDKYEVKYENKMGDMVIGDDIELEITLAGSPVN